MSFYNIIQRINDLPISEEIRQNASAFPWLESVHVMAICTVVGMIAVVDLRLLGVPAHVPSLRRLERQVLPIVWAGFALALVSGILLFASNATRYINNDDFVLKMWLIVATFVNMCFFQYYLRKRFIVDEEQLSVAVGARLAGGISLALWIAVVFFGRRIGFTLAPF